jgi:hypothetical protein
MREGDRFQDAVAAWRAVTILDDDVRKRGLREFTLEDGVDPWDDIVETIDEGGPSIQRRTQVKSATGTIRKGEINALLSHLAPGLRRALVVPTTITIPSLGSLNDLKRLCDRCRKHAVDLGRISKVLTQPETKWLDFARSAMPRVTSAEEVLSYLANLWVEYPGDREEVMARAATGLARYYQDGDHAALCIREAIEKASTADSRISAPYLWDALSQLRQTCATEPRHSADARRRLVTQLTDALDAEQPLPGLDSIGESFVKMTEVFVPGFVETPAGPQDARELAELVL